jgi:hypothetical protein
MRQDCVSELLVDRLIAGELATDAAARVRDHAATCADCGDLLGRAEAAARRFAVAPPPLRLPAPRTARIAMASTALAAAVALVVVAAWRPGSGQGGSDPAHRAKGGPSLGLFVSHGGAVHRSQDGEIVAPGDRLQPVTTAMRPGWIALTAVDGAGLHTVYAAPRPLAAGRDQPLPFSIVLDDTRGPTTLTAVFCPLPFALEAPPDGCTRDAITIEIR